MTEIVRRASAGTLESSDVYVELEPCGEGLEIQLESVVYRQFGPQILAVARQTLEKLQVEKARLRLNDRGALDCVIRARIETAVLRGKEAEE
ncbi:MAG: citrate lyase acyl carrier protein [Peptococcaceae bacterium]|nr:citrate lyase acyl carrier protein [Peptococcaceae bacterium]